MVKTLDRRERSLRAAVFIKGFMQEEGAGGKLKGDKDSWSYKMQEGTVCLA